MTRRNLSLVASIGILTLMLVNLAPAFLPTTAVEASSHREAPLISQDPVADATDFYAFVSPDKPDMVTFITNWIPYENAANGPNWYRFGDDVLYELHIDNVGDAQDHISFQFTFHTVIVNPNTFLYNTGPIGKPDDAQYNVRQYMDVARLDAPSDGSCKDQSLANCPTARRTQLGKDIVVAPANIGPASTPLYSAIAALSLGDLGNGMRTFAGPRADSFFLDLGRTFDLLQVSNPGTNTFAGYNVHTISLQLPVSMITNNGSRPTDPNDGAAVIGSWITSSRRSTKVYSDGATSASGDWVQIERLGMPLVNEVVVPLALKDAFNSLKPWQDATIPAVVNVVTDPELGRLFTALFGLKVPPPPRNDILMVFAQGVKGLNQPPNVVPSEMLRLNVAIPPTAKPNRMGVLGGDIEGFPNGRRLTDDVVDISLQVVAGALVQGFSGANLGDGVNVTAPAGKLMDTFPYQALPWSYATVPIKYLPSNNSNNNP